MISINDIIKEVFSTSFQKKYIEFVNNQDYIYLHEENNDGLDKTEPYNIKVRIPKSIQKHELLLFKNIEMFKSKISFLGSTIPKDSDYILVDITAKKAYLFELKNTSSSANKHIAQQLIAGKHWLHLFLFVINAYKDRNVTDELSLLSNWKIYFTKVKYAIRLDISLAKQGSNKPFYTYSNQLKVNDIHSNSVNLSDLIMSESL